MADSVYSRLNNDVPLKSGETIVDNGNWAGARPVLSVLIPTFNDDPGGLIADLARCDRAGEVEVILYDDGSGSSDLSNSIERVLNAFPGPARLVTNSRNSGRSFARNRLQDFARGTFFLFLDADMLPDRSSFLATYLSSIKSHPEPGLVVGGFSLKRVPFQKKWDLHFAQCEQSECIEASVREQEPGRYVFTSNVMIHRDVMAIVPFDDAFKGWGWEDVDWGLRAARRYPVRHIDNTASHLGLDTAPQLLAKYETSGDNFRRVVQRHATELSSTPLFKASRLISRLPFGRASLIAVSKRLSLAPRALVPTRMRLIALKVFRAAVYGEALRDS